VLTLAVEMPRLRFVLMFDATCMCVCVCVCVCARARVCVCVCVHPQITRQELMEWIKLEGNFQSAVYHDYKALKHKVDEFLKRTYARIPYHSCLTPDMKVADSCEIASKLFFAGAAGKADVPGITYEELQHYFADW